MDELPWMTFQGNKRYFLFVVNVSLLLFSEVYDAVILNADYQLDRI